MSDAANKFQKAREQSLLLKWSRGGQLSKKQIEEIRHLLPADALIDESPAEVDLSGRVHYAKALSEYQPTFGAKVRTLKKWIAIGKAGKPPELPPFDEPEKMSGWWLRHMKQRVPTKIAGLAATLRLDGNADEKGINVSELSDQMADMVRQARGSLAGAWEQLKDAYDGGKDAVIEVKQRRWLKAARALKEAEAAARADAKAAGDLIPKSELLPELSQLLEVLRHMRATMARRIMSRLNVEVPAELSEKLLVTIDKERQSEDAVLRRLKQFQTTEEIDAFQLQYAGE